MRIRLIPPRQRLICFNDDPSTQHEHVMTLFDDAIYQLVREAPLYISG
jgi:hypothetical protein